MNPRELLQAVERFLETLDPAAVPLLTQNAGRLADMVGWATGKIDPEGHLAERLIDLQAALRARHHASPDEGVAAVHDALGMLRAAITSHDSDLSPDDPDSDADE